MDNVKIAFICVILFSLSLALVILLLTMTGSSACNECEALPMWIALNNSLIEINFSEEKNYILVPTYSFSKYFDFYLKKGEIFWVEENNKSTKIYRSWLRNSAVDDTSWAVPVAVAGLLGAKPQVVASLGTCGGLAVDWLHGHIYWADVESGSLEVATLDGSHRRVVYSNKSVVVTMIAVDPNQKLIFWLEKFEPRNKPGSSLFYIKSSNLRGSDTRTVISNIIGPPLYLERNLALDLAKKNIYYLQKPGELARCDYNGQNAVQIIPNLPIPASIGVSTNQLYWMDKFGDVFTQIKNEDDIHKILSVCKDCRKDKKQDLFNLDIQIKVLDKNFQQSAGTETIPNEECLFNTTSFTDVCPCPFGYRTLDRSNSCREEGVLFASYSSMIQGVSVEGRKMSLYFKKNAIIPDFDFHFVKSILFWFDSKDTKIYRAPLSNPSNSYTMALFVKGTAGLALDWVYDNLYWTNNNKLGGCVEVSRLDGSLRQQLILRDKANYFISIAVDPFQGLMYISNWTEGSIERAGMDGGSSHSLVPGGLEQPRSLTLEFTTQYNTYEARQIFWLESYAEESTVIKSCFLQNRVKCREVYSRRGSRPSALTLVHNRLYWLDPQFIYHIRVDNHGRVKKIHVSDKHQESFSLRAYHSRTQPPGQNYCPWNSCQSTELCLPSSLEFSQLNTRCVARNGFLNP